MTRTRVALTALLAAGALGTLLPWYTGTQLEEVLQASVQQSNEQLQSTVPGSRVSLELVSLERGFFATTAHYRLKLGRHAVDHQPAELLFTDRIEHGPLPLSRLKAFELAPVMAASHVELAPSAAAQGWLSGSAGAAPLTGNFVLGYDNGIRGRLTLQPLTFAEGGQSVHFSGMDLDVALGAQAKSVHFTGRMDSLALELIRDGEPLRLRLDGLTLQGDHRLGKSGLYSGDSRLALSRVELVAAGRPPLALSDIVQTDRFKEHGERMSGVFAYDVGQLSYAGQSLGSARLQLSLGDLDAAALKSLGEWYKGFLQHLRTQPDGDTGMSVEERARLQEGVDMLLAGRPSLTLDQLSLKTAHGESRFSLRIDLARPASYELPAPELARQLIGKLDAQLVLAKPMIRDLVMFKAVLDPRADPAALAQEAAQAADMAGTLAATRQLARVEGDSIVSSLSYADGQITLNGQQIPAEQFAELLQAAGPAAGVVVPAGGGEEGYLGDGADEGAADEDSDVEDAAEQP